MECGAGDFLPFPCLIEEFYQWPGLFDEHGSDLWRCAHWPEEKCFNSDYSVVQQLKDNMWITLNTVITTHAEPFKEKMLSEVEQNCTLEQSIWSVLKKGNSFSLQTQIDCFFYLDPSVLLLHGFPFQPFVHAIYLPGFWLFIKGLNMFIIIFLKLQLYMFKALTLLLGDATFLMIKAKEPGQETVVTNPLFFMWSVPSWTFYTGNYFFLHESN